MIEMTIRNLQTKQIKHLPIFLHEIGQGNQPAGHKQQQNGRALEDAGEEMKNDATIVRAAVATRNETRHRLGFGSLTDADIDTWFREVGVPEAVRVHMKRNES